VDASEYCNIAAFQIGSTGMGTTIVPLRSWNLKVIHSSNIDFYTSMLISYKSIKSNNKYLAFWLCKNIVQIWLGKEYKVEEVKTKFPLRPYHYHVRIIFLF
jgi:hypothetical protein